MAILRLAALLIAEIDMVIMFAQRQQSVDATIVTAIIGAVVVVLTLLIQTYGQVQLATIKAKQEAQGKALIEQSAKSGEQSVKVQEIHTLVNSGQSKMIEDMKVMLKELSTLKGEKEQREKSDAAAQNQRIGASEAHVAADNPKGK